MILSTICIISAAHCKGLGNKTYQQPILVGRKILAESVEQLHLVFRIKGPPVDDVLASSITIYAEPFTNLFDTFWAESSLGIDICNFPLSTSLILRELANDRSSHRELGLSSTEFPKNLCDAHSLNTATEHGIEALATSRDTADFAANMTELCGGNEVVGRWLQRG
jgi:hypothetical protein